MTIRPAPAPVAGRWAHSDDVLACATTGGVVVLPAGGGAAVALSGPDAALWAATTEPATADALASLVGAEVAHAGLAALAGLGILREVP